MKQFWILWSPQSQQAPKVRYYSYARAQDVAEWASRQHPEREFFVLKADSVATAQRTVITSTIKKLSR